ncbi:MAG: TldD/PmbA family protein [Candidatus Woesearchaeota archaeon]
MEDAVRLAEKKGAEFAEASCIGGTANHIETNNKDVTTLVSLSRKLYSVRVLYKKGWGQAYSCKDDMKKLVLDAIKNARANQEKSELQPMKAAKMNVKTPFMINPEDVPLKDKLNILSSIESYRTPKIKALRQIYAENIREHFIVNSEGSKLKWKEKGIQYIVQAFAKRGARTEQYVDTQRGRCGFEIAPHFGQCARHAIHKAEQLLDAKPAKGGRFNVMVDQKLGGFFVHEAVGHACEADAALNNASVLGHKIGRKIGSDVFNVVDDGSIREWGWMPFDSEGVKGSRTQLIEKGILEGFIHSRDTASRMKDEVTGNGRSQDLTTRIIPRMTNTIIGPGDSSFDEILHTAKKGYYLKGSLGGQVEPPKGTFLFNAQEGYYFENGEIQHMINNVSLIGNILETLHKVRLIAKDLEYSSGFCGKSGQTVPVGQGSPHLFIEDAMVGGSK